MTTDDFWLMHGNPELIDLYVQREECRAESARAQFLCECAAFDGDPAALETAKQFKARCKQLEHEADAQFARMREATPFRPVPAGPSEEWYAFGDLLHAKKALGYACAALNDAAAAAAEAIAQHDGTALQYWREEMDRRYARFGRLRRTFYQERVLKAPPTLDE